MVQEGQNGQLSVPQLPNGVPDVSVWIWGFGSLIYNPGFKYEQHLDGYVKGWRRTWSQGSTDNRGTPEQPGRTATIEPCPEGTVWGRAFLVPLAKKATILQELEAREQQYDLREWLAVFGRESAEKPVLERALCFIASPANPDWLGPASIEDLAHQVSKASGLSGGNWDYVYRVEEAVRELGENDEELFRLAARVRELRGD